MKIWEYLQIAKRGSLLRSDKLNEIGAQGWELVAVKEAYGMFTGQLKRAIRYYIFKRQVED